MTDLLPKSAAVLGAASAWFAAKSCHGQPASHGQLASGSPPASPAAPAGGGGTGPAGLAGLFTPAEGDSLRARFDQARQALKAMSASALSMRHARSANASGRLQQLLDQVKLLKMMGGNPKIVARQAAELAKEIAAAAKDFAAGADPGGVDIPATATVPPATGAAAAATGQPDSAAQNPGDTGVGASPAATASATTTAATTAAATAAAPTTAAITTAAITTAQDASATAAQAEAQANRAEHLTEAGSASSPAQTAAAPSPQAPQNANKTGTDRPATPQAGAGTDGTARNAAIRTEQLFFDEVKAAVASLRSMVEDGARDAQRKRDKRAAEETAKESETVSKAAAAVDDAVETIGRQGEGETADGPPSGPAGDAGVPPPPQSTPAVSLIFDLRV